jgi:hypothetical protein
MDPREAIDAALSQRSRNTPLTEENGDEFSSEEERMENANPFTHPSIREANPVSPVADMETQRKALIRELKIFLTKKPSLQTASLPSAIDIRLNQMSIEELRSMKENIQIELGHIKPYENATNLVSVLARGFDKYYSRFDSTVQVHDLMTEDFELISAVDHYMPKIFEKLSDPLKIIYRVSYNLNQALFGYGKVYQQSSTIQPSCTKRARSWSDDEYSDSDEHSSRRKSRQRKDDESSPIIPTEIQE